MSSPITCNHYTLLCQIIVQSSKGMCSTDHIAGRLIGSFFHPYIVEVCLSQSNTARSHSQATSSAENFTRIHELLFNWMPVCQWSFLLIVSLPSRLYSHLAIYSHSLPSGLHISHALKSTERFRMQDPGNDQARCY